MNKLQFDLTAHQFPAKTTALFSPVGDNFTKGARPQTPARGEGKPSPLNPPLGPCDSVLTSGKRGPDPV